MHSRHTCTPGTHAHLIPVAPAARHRVPKSSKKQTSPLLPALWRFFFPHAADPRKQQSQQPCTPLCAFGCSHELNTPPSTPSAAVGLPTAEMEAAGRGEGQLAGQRLWQTREGTRQVWEQQSSHSPSPLPPIQRSPPPLPLPGPCTPQFMPSSRAGRGCDGRGRRHRCRWFAAGGCAGRGVWCSVCGAPPQQVVHGSHHLTSPPPPPQSYRVRGRWCGSGDGEEEMAASKVRTCTHAWRQSLTSTTPTPTTNTGIGNQVCTSPFLPLLSLVPPSPPSPPPALPWLASHAHKG